jgi:hypothetical protein
MWAFENFVSSMDSKLSTSTEHGNGGFVEVHRKDKVSLGKSSRARHVGFQRILKGQNSWNLEQRVGEACGLSRISGSIRHSREHGVGFRKFRRSKKRLEAHVLGIWVEISDRAWTPYISTSLKACGFK